MARQLLGYRCEVFSFWSRQDEQTTEIAYISLPQRYTMNAAKRILLCPQPQISRYFAWKSGLDKSVAALLLILVLPIIAVLAVLVRLTSRGPAIYKQVRVGKDGKVFTMYKIRSMRIDAEAATGAVWASRKDPRITLLGTILRKLHLDELPQLFNVVRGDMSLVGPRPERPEFVDKLEQKIDGYRHRLLVKPGITGYAQLNLPSDIDLNDVRKKLVLDFEYIESASLGFDFLLVFGTALKVVKLTGRIPLTLLGIYRPVEKSKWTEPLKVSQETYNVQEQRLDALFALETTTN